MVVFVCGSCNDSLKKNAVANHLNKCRSSVISCCDCGKEFADNSYTGHNQCITEDAKYGPEDKRMFGQQDKGKVKQDIWINAIKETVKKQKISGRTEMALNKLLEFDNIPRKKVKFINFTKNCLNLAQNDTDIIDQLWEICESATKASGAGDAGAKTEEVKEEIKEEPKEDSKEESDTPKEPKSAKKDKKKKKQQEAKEENEENKQTNGDESKSEPKPEVEEVATPAKEAQVENSSKKKSKKKKRNISETEQQAGDSENGSESAKKIKEDPVGEEKMDTSVIEGDEFKSENQIDWFKQLKRQIKEKETVEIKELKKMIKKMKKDHDLKDEFNDLFTKAKVKLMKRHNYSVSEGQIKYQHLF